MSFKDDIKKGRVVEIDKQMLLTHIGILDKQITSLTLELADKRGKKKALEKALKIIEEGDQQTLGDINHGKA